MSGYTIIWELKIRHGFYANGINPGFHVKPTYTTEQLMRRRGVIFKKRDVGCWTLIGPDNSVFAEDDALELSVYANDPHFPYVTVLPGNFRQVKVNGTEGSPVDPSDMEHPFYVQLFRRLGLTDDKPYEFKDKNEQLKAIFLLQYVVSGDREYRRFKEHELTFNKIIVNWQCGPLPMEYDLKEEDKKIAEEMVTSFRSHWDKLSRSTNETLRQAFMWRFGVIKPSGNEDTILLEVEPKPYDMLLDSLPWPIQLQRLYNSDKRLEVKWRG